MFFIGPFSFVFVFLTFYLLPCECLYCSWLLSGIDSLSVFRSCVVLAGAVKEIRHWFAFSSICAYLCMAGGSVYSLPLFLFPLVIPSGSGFSALRNGPDGAVVRPVRPSGCGPFGFPPGPGGILSLPFRRFPPFPAFPSVRGAPAIVSAPSAAVRLFPVFPEFRAIPFPPAPFRPFSSRGSRPRVYYYKVQPRFSCPFLSNIRKSFHFPSFFSFESLAVRDILVTFALAFGNDVPPGRRVSPANEERVL